MSRRVSNVAPFREPHSEYEAEGRAETRPRRFMRIADCASELGCSRNHIRNVIKAKKVDVYKLDGILLIKTADWDAYLDSAQVKT